jgi:uncharacterized protein
MENDQLLRHIYEQISVGNSTPLLDHMHDNITWTIIGTTGLSGTFRGRQEVVDELMAPLRSHLATPISFSIRRVLADGDWTVLLADGAATTIAGRPYNNTYCIVARIVDGRIHEMTDYIDTELITQSLLAPA